MYLPAPTITPPRINMDMVVNIDNAIDPIEVTLVKVASKIASS